MHRSRQFWPVIALFILVIGGIYAGFFTATEAGAMGAIGATIIGVATGQLSLKKFVKCVVIAGCMSGWIMFMLIGVLFFQFFMTISNISFLLGNFVAALDVAPVVIVIAIGVAYLLLGSFLDGPSMIVLTVPILFPVIMSVGLDPIWFGILCVRFVEIGMITPPIGLNCYVLSGASGIPLGTIFKGIFPFLIADFLHVALLIAIPPITMFLVWMM